MLQTHSVTAQVGLEPADFQLVMEALERRGWGAGYLASARTLLKVAGVSGGAIPPPSAVLGGPGRTARLSAEILFRDDYVFYVESAIEITAADVSEEETVRDQDLPNWGTLPFLNVGVVGQSDEDLGSVLPPLLTDLTSCVQSRVDGRKTRHMHFDWKATDPTGDPVKPLRSRARRRSRQWWYRPDETDDSAKLTEMTFVEARFSEEEARGAEVLCDDFIRGVLREACQAHSVEPQGLRAGRPGAQDQVAVAVDKLVETKLLEKEVLISCKQNSAPLLRVVDTSEFTREPRLRARCHYCQRTLLEENRSEVFAPSELGERLNRKSHWLTVWATVVLESAGVSRDHVRWSVSESGEEIDLVAGLFDESWIFELKDREFGGGDAHPFSYRCLRYEPDQSFVVTPKKVSEEAKRIFVEIAADRGQSAFLRTSGPSGSEVPTYIEGLTNLAPILKQEVQDCARRYAVGRLEAVRLAANIPVERILDGKFG